MSSVQKGNVKVKRSGFLIERLVRSPSIQKIKCSANQLQGSIFSKESSITHHLKSLMSLSQTYVHKPALGAVVPLVHVIGVAMAILMSLITKHSGRTIPECLEKFIIKINQWKSKHQQASAENKIIQLTAERLTQILLHIASHFCMVFVYFQLGFLFYFIGFTRFRLGFMFLIICISYVHFIVFKISFMKKRERCSRRQLHNKKLIENQIEMQKNAATKKNL